MNNLEMVKTALLGSSSSNKLDSYPVLKIIKMAFTYLSLAILVIGVLYSIYTLFDDGFIQFIATLIATVFGWGVIKIQAEFIQLAVDIADNTRRTAEALENKSNNNVA